MDIFWSCTFVIYSVYIWEYLVKKRNLLPVKEICCSQKCFGEKYRYRPFPEERHGRGEGVLHVSIRSKCVIPENAHTSPMVGIFS